MSPACPLGRTRVARARYLPSPFMIDVSLL